MKPIEIIILAIVVVLFTLAIIYMVRHRGSCCGNCKDCRAHNQNHDVKNEKLPKQTCQECKRHAEDSKQDKAMQLSRSSKDDQTYVGTQSSEHKTKVQADSLNCNGRIIDEDKTNKRQ